MTKKYLLSICISIFTVTYVVSNTADVILDSDDNNMEVNRESNNALDKEEIKLGNNNICHMEIQLTKRVIGYCVKHGIASHSCLADGYLHPFHRECMSSG